MVATIRIRNFGGLMPRAQARTIPENAATIAENTKLWSNAIKGYRAPLAVDDCVVPNAVTIYKLRDKFLSWDKDVDVVGDLIPNDPTGRFFYTGDGVPKHSNYGAALHTCPFPSESYTLGVVAPNNKPRVQVSGLGDLPAERRSYVYTYVNRWYEESAPSYPSALAVLLIGQSVLVNNFAPSSDPNVTAIRIYRTAPGTTGNGGEFLFVAELPITATEYLDTKLDIDLGEQLQSSTWSPPPPNLIALAGMPNSFLVGIDPDTNTLCFSEPKQPHAWPPEYRKAIQGKAVGLGVYGNTVVVLTDGNPNRFTTSDPRNVVPEIDPDPYPCISKRSITRGNRGVLFASTNGLGFVGYGGTEIATRTVITRDVWLQDYAPREMHGAFFDGRYYGFSPKKSFVFDTIDQSAAYDESARLVELSQRCGASFAAENTELYFTVTSNGTDTIYQWEGGTGGLEWNWRSKEFTEYGNVTFAAAKIVGDFPGPASAVGRVLLAEYATYANAAQRSPSPAATNGAGIGGSGHHHVVDYSWLAAYAVARPEVNLPRDAVRLFLDTSGVQFTLYNEHGRAIFSREVFSSEPFRVKPVNSHIATMVELRGTREVRDVQLATSVMDLVEREG